MWPEPSTIAGLFLLVVFVALLVGMWILSTPDGAEREGWWL